MGVDGYGCRGLSGVKRVMDAILACSGQLRIDRTVEHGVGKAVQMIPSVPRSALRHVAHI